MAAPEPSPAPSAVRAEMAVPASPPGTTVPAAGSAWIPLARDGAARLQALCQEIIVGLLMALILVLPMARARWTRSAILVAAALLWMGRWALGARPVWRRTPIDWP